MPVPRALLWALAFGALLLLIFLGRLGLLATLVFGTFIPLPLLLVGWGWGLGPAALLAGAASLVLLGVEPTWAGFLEQAGLWSLFLLGLLLVWGHKRHWHAGSAILVATLAVGVFSLMLFGLQALLAGVGPLDFWERKSKEILTALSAILRQGGMELADLRLMGVPQGEMPQVIRRILPALALINTAMVAWLNVLLGRRLAESAGWELEAEPLRTWTCPEWLVFVLLGAGFALLAPLPGVRTLGLNLLLLTGLAYFFQGLAVVATFLRRNQAPPVVRFLIYLLTFVNPVMILVTLLGLADLWLDFRRLQPPREA